MKYFSKVPLVTYNGQSARNLLARAKLSDDTKQNSTIFYPYTVDGESRTDILSYKYYDHSDYMWLVWMANEVVDPYYDVALSQINLEAHVAKKYGSIQKAQNRIIYWRNDWVEDETILTPSQYNALPCFYDEANDIYVNVKKYYDPVLDIYNSVYGYSRKKEDWVASTNRVATFGITGSGDFIPGERISRNSNNYGSLVLATDTEMTIQHITGTFSNGDVIVGSESGASRTITTTPYVNVTIPTEELSLWTPVTYWEFEQEQNEKKKEITLIDNRYKQAIEEELSRVFKQ